MPIDALNITHWAFKKEGAAVPIPKKNNKKKENLKYTDGFDC